MNGPVIEHGIDHFPGKLVNADDMAAALTISVDSLLEYVESGHAPHYRVDNGPPMFIKQETYDWAAKNLLARFHPRNLPDKIVTLRLAGYEQHINRLPIELAQIGNLVEAPFLSCPITGVYFLCGDGKTQYVGQAKNVVARVGQHIGDKVFDSVYVLPCPRSALNRLEAAFIRTLKPSQNMSMGTAISERERQRIVAECGLDERMAS